MQFSSIHSVSLSFLLHKNVSRGPVEEKLFFLSFVSCNTWYVKSYLETQSYV